jgi:uncharacterized membrane protein
MPDVIAAAGAMPATERAVSVPGRSSRIVSVDFMRGLVMVIMAIDRSRITSGRLNSWLGC